MSPATSPPMPTTVPRASVGYLDSLHPEDCCTCCGLVVRGRDWDAVAELCRDCSVALGVWEANTKHDPAHAALKEAG